MAGVDLNQPKHNFYHYTTVNKNSLHLRNNVQRNIPNDHLTIEENLLS